MLLIGISSILVFVLAKPQQYTRISVSYVNIDNFLIERREDDRSVNFYYQTEENITIYNAIAISYSIYELENQSFIFIVDTQSLYIHATINNGGYASGIVVSKNN